MIRLLKKELKLSASVLSYYFIAFGLMFFIPGYPILCGAFFVCLGLFQSFQASRENNDIVYSALLPIAKKEVVKGKYIFACFIELCAFVLMLLVTAIRMTFLSNAEIYRTNVMMNANFFALAMALLIFGLFNALFIGGFFKTAYKFAKPFVIFIIVAFICIGIGEALHHFPNLEGLNSFGFDGFPLQFVLLIAGAILFAALTVLSYFGSVRKFNAVDL